MCEWVTCNATLLEEAPAFSRMTPGDLAQKARLRHEEADVSSNELHLRLSSGPDAISAARRCLDPLELSVGQDRLRDVQLLVSELVTNSVRHARRSDEVELAVTVTRESIRVCVTDRGPGFEAEPRHEDADPGSGWGLFLVEQLSDRWGVELNGKTQVWFELGR
jgi:anti-sigma regulatory factor (Ser/Thr protein kinase)